MIYWMVVWIGLNSDKELDIGYKYNNKEDEEAGL